MKLFIILPPLLLLSACLDDASCFAESDQKLRAKLFDNCLRLATDGRKGRDYITNDDEDFDEVIKECGSQAYKMSFSKEHCKSEEQPR